MSIGISSSPSPEEIDARLALLILQKQSPEINKINTKEAKQKLRELLEESEEMLGQVQIGENLDARVEVALARAFNCLEAEALGFNLKVNSGVRPSFLNTNERFLNTNERTSNLAKTVSDEVLNKIVLRNWVRFNAEIDKKEIQRMDRNIVAVSQLWTNMKQRVQNDLEKEVSRLVGGFSLGFGRKKRTEELYEIMRLPDDPDAILQQISEVNRPVALRFPKICKSHVESCRDMLKDNLQQKMPWNEALSLYQNSMSELENKLNFLSQAEDATQQSAIVQRSLEKSTHIDDRNLGSVQTIDHVLHQTMREIYTWSDGIQLNGEPFKMTTLIQILGIPLNEKCKDMPEDELAKFLAINSGMNFVDEKGWQNIDSSMKKSILQHISCFNATMIDTVPIQRKFVKLGSDQYNIQISQSKSVEEGGGNRELFRPYRGEFILTRSYSHVSGFEITGYMEKNYPVILSEDSNDPQRVGTIKGSAKIDSNQKTDDQVTFSFGQLMGVEPILSDPGMQERLEESLFNIVKGDILNIRLSPDKVLESNSPSTRYVENDVNVSFLDTETGQYVQQFFTLRRLFVPNQEGVWLFQSQDLFPVDKPSAWQPVGEVLSGEQLPEEPEAEIKQDKERRFSDADAKYLNDYIEDPVKNPVNIHIQEEEQNKFDI